MEEWSSASYSAYTEANYPLPVPHPALHYALLHENIDEVRRLLELGARPCLEQGEHSCFAYEKVEGEFYDGKSMRWFRSSDHEFNEDNEWEVMKLLLLYEPRGVNILSCKVSKSLLMRFGYTAANVEYLVNLGANVNEKDLLNRTPVLHISEVYYFKPEVASVIILLLQSGSDPLPQRRYNALEKIVEIIESDNKNSIELLEYLLALSEDKKELVVNCDTKNHPQSLMLDVLVESGFKDEIMTLFNRIMNSKYKNTHLIYEEKGMFISNDNLSPHYLLECPLKSITYCILGSHNNTNLDLYEMIELLLKHGFTCDGFSPLTAYIASLGSDNSDCKLMKYVSTESQLKTWQSDERIRAVESRVAKMRNIIKLLIDNGAHVQQKIMTFWDPVLRHTSKKYCLPDVLYIAVNNDLWVIVRLLLEHWCYPPLALLIFRIPWITLTYYVILASHCYAVPHGTKLFKDVKKSISKSENKFFIQHFKENHSSPLSLMELCRYKIRACLVKHTCQPESNLRDMLVSLSPPGLKQFLLMEAPDSVVICQCDSELLIKPKNMNPGVDLEEPEENINLGDDLEEAVDESDDESSASSDSDSHMSLLAILKKSILC